MKFSDFTAASWEENRKYYDTCLLPFTGLKGTESPPEAVKALERLRDLLDSIEGPFQGRIVTYPAVQYMTAESCSVLNDICRKVKSSSFQHVIVASATNEISVQDIYESDLVLSLYDFDAADRHTIMHRISDEIQQMWLRNS